MDQGGNYILVLFADITSEKQNERVRYIEEELHRLDYYNSVRVYSACQIIEFANKHLSLIINIKRISYCIPHNVWGNYKSITLPKKFIGDDERNKFIDFVRTKLLETTGQTKIFRVAGLSGIGKTRLVYEAVNFDGLRQTVIYVDATQFLHLPLYFQLQNDNELSATLVIDDCSVNQHYQIEDTFSTVGDRLSIITLSNEIGEISNQTYLYNLQPLNVISIKEILAEEFQSLPNHILERLAVFADGFPRIGIILGESYSKDISSSKYMIDMPEEHLFRRLLGLSTPVTVYENQILKVLSLIAMFEKIGFKGMTKHESEWIIEKIGISTVDYNQIIHDQKARGIIQGINFIYITPAMLRIYLINYWWDINGFENETELNLFFIDLPDGTKEDLLNRFFQNLPLAASNEKALLFSQRMLESDLFTKNNGDILKSEFGSRLFLYLTKTNPEQAIILLNNTISKWDFDNLNHFYTGRRNIIWALEEIVSNKDLFIDGSNLLLKLAETENEYISNNATGVFSNLFTPSHGFFSTTEASPSLRSPILRKVLNSDKLTIRRIGLKACDAGLRTGGYSKSINTSTTDLRIQERTWNPDTYGEIFKAYEEIWNLLTDFIRQSTSEEERFAALNIILKHSREISGISYLSDMVVGAFEEFSQIENFRKALLEQVIHILRYKKTYKDQETKLRWERLETQLSGSSYSELLQRYIGMNLIEDRYNSSGKQTNKYENKVNNLAKYSLEHKEEFINELDWLFSSEAKNSQHFGMLLYQVDHDLSFLNLMIAKISPNNYLGLLGGYLRALHNEDEKKWETILETKFVTTELANYLLEITYWSGVSDFVVLKVIELCQMNKIESKNLHFIGILNRITNISYDTLIKWLQFLISRDNFQQLIIALHDMYTFFVDAKKGHPLPKEITFSILTSLAICSSSDRNNSIKEMDEYYWIQLSQLFISQYPEEQMNFAKVLLEVIGSGNGLLAFSISEPTKILGIILENNKLEFWNLITQYLEEEYSYQTSTILDWLGGEETYFGQKEYTGLIDRIPQNIIFDWGNENPSLRAPIIAKMSPRSLSIPNETSSFVREVLINYGDIDSVRDAITNIFLSGSWEGPASEHYRSKKNDLETFMKDETNSSVLLWAKEYTKHLDDYIERHSLNEERRGF